MCPGRLILRCRSRAVCGARGLAGFGGGTRRCGCPHSRQRSLSDDRADLPPHVDRRATQSPAPGLRCAADDDLLGHESTGGAGADGHTRSGPDRDRSGRARAGGAMSTRRWGRVSTRLPVTEKALQQTIVAAAKLLNWRCYHTYDSRKSQPGFPDLCLVKGKSLLFIECKTSSGKLTQKQGDWLVALQAVPGVLVHVARPNDLDSILEILKDLEL